MSESIYPPESVIDGILFKLVGGVNPTVTIDPDSIIPEQQQPAQPREAKYLIWVLNRSLYRYEWVSLDKYQMGNDEAKIAHKKIDLYHQLKAELGDLVR
jgi:hypothetical protein